VAVQEPSWVRSVYLYLMCLVSVLLVGVGSIAALGGLVHTVVPDLGHRDTLDRVGIGLSNIAANVVQVVNDSQGNDNSSSYCRDVTDNERDFQACMDDQGISGDSMSAIQDGISEVKSELQSQIRHSSIDQMIRGLLMVGAGLLVFRIHGRRTELFANGLLPARSPAAEPIPPPPPAEPPAPKGRGRQTIT
jgi:hypothetical protein